MGSKGYALLIEHGIETAKELAKEIEKRESFQLMTPPELNLLTYRICPPSMRQQLSDGNSDEIKSVNQKLNTINRAIQMLQREAGNSFVSRTLMMINNNPENEIVVLRCVVMNPLTDMRILNKILDEQEEIFKSRFAYKST
jgi:glutamate decarboxylase